MTPGASYLLKHTTRTVKAFVNRILYKIDVNTLHRDRSDSFALNEIGRVEIKTSLPVFFDPYRINQGTGSFILIDPLNNHTVAAGMIRGPARSLEEVVPGLEEKAPAAKSPDTVWSGWNIPREAREERNGHKAAVLWFTGYSGAGKSTIARALEKRLFVEGYRTVLLDGDQVRHGLCGDLGFSDRDRTENIRRVGEVAHLFFQTGAVVLCTFISPFEKDRAFVRSLILEGSFLEVFVKCDLDVCKRRDPNGLYKKAMNGQIKEFTGISSPYEPPPRPEITVETDLQSIDEILETLLGEIGRLREPNGSIRHPNSP
jgi:bifunctional enzyme CysN/CysC